MNAWSRFTVVAMAGCLGALVASAAGHAAEITVVASQGPLPDVMGTLVPMFESATGNKVKISFKGAPAIAADLKQGAADLVITNTEVVDALAADGDVAGNGKTLLMISKVGIAVKAGAPKPDIGTPDKLKAALLAAKTVGYSEGASGRHFLTLIQKLGIADAVKAKAVVAQGRPGGPPRVRRGGDRRAEGSRAAAGSRHRGDRRDAGRAAEADPLFGQHRHQGEGRGHRAGAGRLPALASGAGRAQAQGHGPALMAVLNPPSAGFGLTR